MKKEKSNSIRKQLLSWILIPIISLCVVTAIISYVIAIHITTQAYDAALLEGARELANRLRIENGQTVLDLPPSALAIFKEDKVDKFYHAVLSDRGRVVGGDPEILPMAFQLSGVRLHGKARFFNRKINRTNVRLACIETPVPGQLFRKAKIFLAETTLKRQALISEILGAVIVPQLCFITAAALAVWFGVARGLAPLEPVRRAISRRNPWDLRPVKQLKTPVEIQPLVSAIDDLLVRLNDDIESQHRFVANAAHQLRTPLAGLKTQIELSSRTNNKEELDNIIKQVNRSVDNMTRLVNQLLSLAKLEPSSAWLVKQSEIDLNPVIKEATSDLVPWAVDKEIDLGFEGADKPAVIAGDKSSIRELVTNLIDNAVRYTQPGGKVTVRLAHQQSDNSSAISVIDLFVEDDGPGIPESERDKVFERFYRVLGNNVTGSGLGLSIVKEIVQAHDAKIYLVPGEDGKGTIARVSFPAKA